MMKKILLVHIFPFITLLILVGCSDSDHTPVPIILSPEMHGVYYPDQEITFRWAVPDSSRRVAMQIIFKEDDSFYLNAEGIMDTTDVLQTIENTTRYRLTFSEGLNTTTYGAFRVRYQGPSGWSDWSGIRFFRVDPYSALEIKPFSITATFSFHADNKNSYYADHVQSENTISLKNEILSRGYDLTKLEFVRPLANAGKVEIVSDHPDHIDRIVFGFPGHHESYPFKPFGDASGLLYSPPPAVYPYHDWHADLGDSEVPMEMVYFLSQFHELNDELGVHHSISVTVDLNGYFRKND